MRGIRSFVAFCVVLASVASAAADDKPDPRENLDTAIPEGLRLLEAREYAAFLKNFVPPDELKKATQKATLEEFAKRFGEKKAPRLLEVLKEVKGAKPTVDAKEAEATYDLREEIGGTRKITFIKIGKLWYIKN